MVVMTAEATFANAVSDRVLTLTPATGALHWRESWSRDGGHDRRGDVRKCGVGPRAHVDPRHRSADHGVGMATLVD